MRSPGRKLRPHRIGFVAVAVLIAGVVVACGSAASSATPRPPTPSPYAFPTPWPPFTTPPTADQVYLALLADRIEILPTTASSGANGKDPIKQIDGTYKGLPITIGQYKTAATLKAATKWKPGATPKAGESAAAFIGQDILVRWGPAVGPTVTTLTDAQVTEALALRSALERLLGPLTDRTIVPVAVATPIPSASPRSSSAASANP